MALSHDTIFALSSGRPPSGIAVVRISGPQAASLLTSIVGRLPNPRQATFATLRDAENQAIDDAVVLWFPGPHSATGEDTAELQVHGSNAVLASVFQFLASFPQTRPAEAGEFTRRAFENGKLDLTEAEGLDDLIHADTDAQRRQALRQLKGYLGQRAERWRQQIIEALALIEAGIDFSDEGDVPAELLAPAFARIDALRVEIEEALRVSARSERLRDGLVVAITGPPNVGKSSLLNRLAQRDAAIVSPHAGTTRDIIEVQLDLGGYPVLLLDTAGIRETADPIEQEGVRRAQARAADADLVLWLVDASVAPGDAVTAAQGDAPMWCVLNKSDLIGPGSSGSTGPAKAAFRVSATTGSGLEQLTAAITEFAGEYFASGESALISRARHRQLLEQTAAGLRSALSARAAGEEIIAEELRVAASALGRLLGRVDVEDILDVIFRDFCIGK